MLSTQHSTLIRYTSLLARTARVRPSGAIPREWMKALGVVHIPPTTPV